MIIASKTGVNSLNLRHVSGRDVNKEVAAPRDGLKHVKEPRVTPDAFQRSCPGVKMTDSESHFGFDVGQIECGLEFI
jgi:hypothetical protein